MGDLYGGPQKEKGGRIGRKGRLRGKRRALQQKKKNLKKGINDTQPPSLEFLRSQEKYRGDKSERCVREGGEDGALKGGRKSKKL